MMQFAPAVAIVPLLMTIQRRIHIIQAQHCRSSLCWDPKEGNLLPSCKVCGTEDTIPKDPNMDLPGMQCAFPTSMPVVKYVGKVNKARMPRKKDNPNLRLAELGMKGTGFVKSVKEAGFGFIK